MPLSVFTISGGSCDAAPKADAGFIAAFRGMTVAFGSGDLTAEETATALFADAFAMEEGSRLDLELPLSWAGVVWRLGGRARRHLLSPAKWSAIEAHEAGLCEAIATAGTSPADWVARWIAGRDLIALESAALLLRHRTGDVLERSEFARLFATGSPQAGLEAFLNRKRGRGSES